MKFLISILICTSTTLFLTGCIGSGSCDQFNIDSFELTSGMNIPKVLDVECYSNDSLRISVFRIDTAASGFLKKYNNIEGYIERYEMKPLAVASDLRLKGLNLLPVTGVLSAGDLYVAEGRNKQGRYWKYVVSIDENTLISEMEVR